MERAPVSSSKKSSTTPWDAAFGDAPEIVPREEKVPPQAAGTTANAGGDDGMMYVDDDDLSQLQHQIAESVVAPEPVVVERLRPTAREAETSLADLRLEKTAPTVSKADPQVIVKRRARTFSELTHTCRLPRC